MSSIEQVVTWAGFAGYGGYVWSSVILVIGGIAYAFARLHAQEKQLCQSYRQYWQEEEGEAR